MHARRRSPPRSLRGDRAAVSDIIGSILLVAMTVAMAVAFALLLFAFDGPADKQYTNLAATLDPGPDGQWNTGNEEIRLTHLGGEPLSQRGTTILYQLGSNVTALSGSGLGSAFGDGQMTIGERWMRGATFALDDLVQVRVTLSLPGQQQLLANAAVVAGSTTVGNVCLGDVTAPTAALSQSPLDVTSATTGAVTIQALLSDNCSGVASGVTPNLWYCISATCPAPSNPGTGYTSLAMSRPDPTNQPQLWQASIPAPLPLGAWSVNLGKTITYYVYPLTDNAVPANTGRSATGTDPVNVFTQYKYAESHVDTVGTVANFASLAADDGAEGSFTEAVVAGAAGTMTLNANGVTSGSGWTTTASATASDDTYAMNSNTNPNPLQLAYANPGSNPGTVTQVVVRAEVNVAGASNDGWQLQACLSAVLCNTLSPTFTATQTDSTISYDVSAARPGGGTWSWTDINSLDIRITPIKSGSRDGTWQVDNAVVDVTYAPTYGMTIQMGFGTVQSGATHTLQLEYHIGVGSNNYNVQFATGCTPTCTWTTQGAALSSTSLATYTHVFTAAEISAGYQVRIVTPNASQDTSPSQVFLDYARVATT